MKQKILKAIMISFGILLWGFIISYNVVKQDDPPKDKPKKDTTKIDIEQMRQKNAAAGKRSLMLDSLIMKLDTLKIKK